MIGFDACYEIVSPNNGRSVGAVPAPVIATFRKAVWAVRATLDVYRTLSAVEPIGTFSVVAFSVAHYINSYSG